MHHPGTQQKIAKTLAAFALAGITRQQRIERREDAGLIEIFPIQAIQSLAARIGGQMQGRLQLNTEEKVARAAKMGISDPNKIYTMEEMARGDVLFAATGVTDGNLLQGVRFTRDAIVTHTIVMRSSSRTVRANKARHQDLAKFD